MFTRNLLPFRGFLSGTSGKRPACQCRRHERFDPSVRKIPWKKAWQPTPVFLPGESHGQRSLMGYSPKGCKELGITEVTEHILCIRHWVKHLYQHHFILT